MPDEADFKRPLQRIKFVQTDLPARLVAQRASDCASFPRALLFWEAHIRQLKHGVTSSEQKTTLMQQLQKIYAQIDEPDGIEGLSAHLHVLDMDQQLLEHRKAGRWTAAQNWYELELCVNPRDVDLQTNLLECLKQSGHQGSFSSTAPSALGYADKQ